MNPTNPINPTNSWRLTKVAKAHIIDSDRGMVRAIYRAVTDKKLVRTLVEEGLKHSKKFSWAEFAKQTLTVYQKAMARL